MPTLLDTEHLFTYVRRDEMKAQICSTQHTHTHDLTHQLLHTILHKDEIIIYFSQHLLLDHLLPSLPLSVLTDSYRLSSAAAN